MTTQKKNIQLVWLILVAIITIFRIFITGDRDILALNSPHDEYWYIKTAFNNIWGGNYDQMTFVHLPIYSGWFNFLYLFGLPARLAIDAAWLLASAYLAFAFFHLSRVIWLAVFMYVFLAFHPYSIAFFDRALSETFLTVVSAAVIGGGIELWNCRNHGQRLTRQRIALIVYGLGFAIAYHTRKEGIVLLVPIVMLALWSWIDRQNWWSNLGKKQLGIPLILAPLMATMLLGSLLASGNYLKWGVWARYELAAPGYQRVMAALNRIDVGRTPKHFTITKAVLNQAYQQSPTFRELQPFMEGSQGDMWTNISAQNTGIPGEIGNGWFFWALRDAAAAAGWHKNARLADSKYAAAADELESAFISGKLTAKWMLLSAFLDPDLGKWLPAVPQSLANVLQLVVAPSMPDLRLPKENASTVQMERYVMFTERRRLSSVSDEGVVIGVNGWIIMPTDTVVGLGTSDASFAHTRLAAGTQRPDVPGAYAFSVSVEAGKVPTELQIASPDGKTGRIALNVLKAQTTAISTGELAAQLGIDNLVYSLSHKTQRAEAWLPGLCGLYQYLGYGFCLSAIAGGMLLIARRKSLSGMVLVLGLVIATIAARVVLFSVIDASSFNALQARYMLPVIPAFACMGVISCIFLFKLGKDEDRMMG